MTAGSGEHWHHFADRFGSDTSRRPTRLAARSQLGLRPERNRRRHRRDLDRVSVDGSPLVPALRYRDGDMWDAPKRRMQRRTHFVISFT